MTTSHDDMMLDTRQAAAYLGMKSQTLNEWRCRRVGPRYIKLGNKAVRYRVGDLRAYVEEQAVEPDRLSAAH